MESNDSVKAQETAVPNAVGDILRQSRKAQNKTQYDVAEELGVPQGTVSRWETGDIKRTKDHERLIDIARVYQVHPSLLLTVGWYENHEIPLLPKETLRLLAQLTVEEIEGLDMIARKPGFLRAYRRLTPEQQHIINVTAEAFAQS